MIKLQIEAKEAYSKNIITSKWWNLDEVEDIEEIYQYYLSDNLIIVDSETEVKNLSINKDDDILKLIIINEELNAITWRDIEKIEYLLYDNNDIDYAVKNYNNVIVYDYGNLKELARELVDDGVYGSIPEEISYYIDYESIASDLEFDYVEYDGRIFCKNY